jgi:hypothetical protein
MAPADWSSAVFCGPAAKGQRLLAEQLKTMLKALA